MRITLYTQNTVRLVDFSTNVSRGFHNKTATLLNYMAFK